MPWVRIDESFPEHPKVLAAGPPAAWLHVCALAYCNRHLTDGFVSKAVLARLSDGKRTTALAGQLVAVGLWETVDGGWEIHDFLQYQPSKATVESERAKARERMANARRSSTDVRPNTGRSSPEVRLTRPVPPVPSPPSVSQSCTNSGNGYAPPDDDDDFKKTIDILVEHKARMNPPDNRQAWEKTTVPNTIAENGPQVRAQLAGGNSPLQAATAVIGSAAYAELAARNIT